MHISGNTSFKHYGLLALTVLLFSLIGIYWRPLDQLSTLWPANAILLGIFLRVPQLAKPAGWLAAALGYIAADLLTGSAWLLAVALNLTNLISVAVALALCQRIDEAGRNLTSPGALPRLFLAVAAAALLAGLAGGLLLWHTYGAPLWSSAAAWAASEWLSYIVLLPTILTVPAPRLWRWRERRSIESMRLLGRLAPLLCLVLSLLATLVIGGPGALAFPVIALLACALMYGLFVTSLLTLASSLWTLLSIAFGDIPLAFDINDSIELLSVRLGVASIALAPIAVASVMAAREKSLLAMRHLAEHDALTDLLNRRTFHERAGETLTMLAHLNRPAAVLMVDVDYFKRINDTYGHAVGDEVLRVTAKKLRQSLRDCDLCGRVGGEEFSILIPECDQALLERITQRVHRAIGDETFRPDDPQPLRITLSIGATLSTTASDDLEAMLLRADLALYAAKNGGRNQTRFG